MKYTITCLSLCLVMIGLLFGTEFEQATTQKYNVTSSSTYQQLFAAFQQATTDYTNNTSDATALVALEVIYGWVPLNERVKFNYDDINQESDNGLYLAGIIGCNEAIEAGATVDGTTKQALADNIWQKLTGLQPSNHDNQELANTAVITLLLLNDDRGLEAILTDTEYIKNLQATDGWDKDSPQTKFADLVTEHTALVGQEAGAREQAAIYELARLRKAGGATEIVSTNSVIDLSKF